MHVNDLCKRKLSETRMRLLGLLSAFLFLFLSANGQSGMLVVANNGEGQALLVEAVSLKTVAALPVGASPHDVAVSNDGRFAYIAIMGTREVPGNTLSVVDLKKRSVEKPIDLGKYTLCHDVKVSRKGDLVWTTCAPSNAVLEIDARSRTIVRKWDLPDDGAWMLVATPDDKKIYTANLEGKSINIVDRKTNKVTSLKFASGQIGIDVSPNGREVWVHHIDKSKISVIDTKTDKVIATFASSGKGAGRLKFTPDGKKVLVPQLESKNVAVFDAASRKLVADIPLSVAPKVITISADSRKAFITSPTTNKLLVVDLVTLKETAAVEMGKNTDGVAFVKP